MDPFMFDIFWDDLTEDIKQQIRDKAKDENFDLDEDDRNWDVLPLAEVLLDDVLDEDDD